MCGLPQAQGDSAEVLQYKLALIRDVLAINLMNAKLSRVAYHDALTGLRTRRVMEEAIAEEHARSTRNGHPFCVTMVDVDNFKSVNDRHGHPAGDKMLLELAGILRANARAYDLIARCGGDEFVLLMPETPLDVAAAVAERIRHRVESDLTVPDGRQVTISCGVAEWAGEAEDTGTAVLRRADVALYEAKRSGRNRVVPAVAPAPAK